MAKTKLVPAIFLVVALSGCKQASQEQRAKELMREADSLAEQSTKLTSQWTNEYQKAFTPANRAKFPANRDWLRAQADKIIVILDEGSSLDRITAEKYEEASALSTNDQKRKAVSLIAMALRKNIEINELLKAQMQLVSNEEIKDDKTLSEKILQSWQLVQQKQRESEEQIKEGKRLLGQ